MTKEEYLAEKSRINKQIIELQEKRKQIAIDFIEEHRKFSDGEKIRIIEDEHPNFWHKEKIIPKTERMAYVFGAEISMRGDVTYILKKEKKDGGMSSFSDYANESEYCHLEKI